MAEVAAIVHHVHTGEWGSAIAKMATYPRSANLIAYLRVKLPASLRNHPPNRSELGDLCAQFCRHRLHRDTQILQALVTAIGKQQNIQAVKKLLTCDGLFNATSAIPFEWLWKGMLDASNGINLDFLTSLTQLQQSRKYTVVRQRLHKIPFTSDGGFKYGQFFLAKQPHIVTFLLTKFKDDINNLDSGSTMHMCAIIIRERITRGPRNPAAAYALVNCPSVWESIRPKISERQRTKIEQLAGEWDDDEDTDIVAGMNNLAIAGAAGGSGRSGRSSGAAGLHHPGKKGLTHADAASYLKKAVKAINKVHKEARALWKKQYPHKNTTTAMVSKEWTLDKSKGKHGRRFRKEDSYRLRAAKNWFSQYNQVQKEAEEAKIGLDAGERDYYNASKKGSDLSFAAFWSGGITRTQGNRDVFAALKSNKHCGNKIFRPLITQMEKEYVDLLKKVQSSSPRGVRTHMEAWDNFKASMLKRTESGWKDCTKFATSKRVDVTQILPWADSAELATSFLRGFSRSHGNIETALHNKSIALLKRW